jgi:hypothetical protein
LALATGSGYDQIISGITHREGGKMEFGSTGISPHELPCDSVFSALRLVTCGQAVHKAVEKRCLMRVTSHILWIACGQAKNPENDAAEGLRGPAPRQ